MALHVHRDRIHRDVRRRELDVHRERRRVAAQPLRPDAEQVDRRGELAPRARAPSGSAQCEPSGARRRDLGEVDAQVRRAADADADDRRRAGLAAGVEHAVDDEGLDRVDAFGRDRHLAATSCSPSRCPWGSSRSAGRRTRRRSRCGSPARRCRRTCARSCASADARSTSAADTRASRARSRAGSPPSARRRRPRRRGRSSRCRSGCRCPGTAGCRCARRPRCSRSSCRAPPSPVAPVSRAASAAKPRLMSGGRILQRADVELLRGVLDPFRRDPHRRAYTRLSAKSSAHSTATPPAAAISAGCHAARQPPNSDQQQPQSAGQMHGQQEHERDFARLDERLLGPGEDAVERCGAGQRLAQHAGNAAGRKIASARPGDAMHARTPTSPRGRARASRCGGSRLRSRSRHRRHRPDRAQPEREQQPPRTRASPCRCRGHGRRAISATIVRRPIGAWIATPTTNTP